MYNHHTKAFEEMITYLFIMGGGTITSIIIGRLWFSNPIDLLMPMIGGSVASLALCFRWYNSYRKAEQEAIKKEIEYRKRDIRSWCEDIHRQNAPYWLIHSQIEGAKRRELNEELQYYYY